MRKVLCFSLALSLFCAGCSTAWVATLDSILAAAAPALIDILQIAAVAEGKPVNAAMAAKIDADAASLKSLAADFAASSAAASAGACRQLQAAVGVYQADQQQVLRLAQVGDANTQTKIDMLADLVAGTISAITAVIPSCDSAAAEGRHRGGATAQTTGHTEGHGGNQGLDRGFLKSRAGKSPSAYKYDAAEFAYRYNEILLAPTGNLAVDAATPKLKLRRHGVLARYGSLGLIQ